MKNNLKIALAFLAIGSAPFALAQSPNASGLLGQRFAELSAGVLDPQGISGDGFSGDLRLNLPVQAGLDVGVGYGYSRIKADAFSGFFRQRSRDHTLYSSVTAYRDFGPAKPFLGAALGYQWTKHQVSFGGARVIQERDDSALWGLGVGAEIPCGMVTVTPTINYQDGFERGSPAGFAYGVDAHMWFTRAVGGFAGVTYSDPTGGGTQAWLYQIGARLRF